MSPKRWRVIVVGAGPAGSATALHLLGRAPELGGQILLLDKARHPRDKVCAGGLIPRGWALLESLRVAGDVPHVRVDAARVGLPGGRRVSVHGSHLCRIVRRRELDALLAWTARDRGAVLMEDTRVLCVSREDGGVRVETTAGTHWAPAVVGADGSGSIVRRSLVPGTGGRIARAVMAEVPETGSWWDGRRERRYDFSFEPVARGMRGYTWVFPCQIDGVPHLNLGAYALPPVTGQLLHRALDWTLRETGTRPGARKAFPIRTWSGNNTLAAPGVLLVGDAAGTDPLMGEGISLALEYGMAAAEVVLAHPTIDRRACARYAEAVRAGWIGRKLRRLDLASRLFYGAHHRFWFRVARASRRAQRIGLAWFNGVEGWDRRSPWAALGELVWPRGVARA